MSLLNYLLTCSQIKLWAIFLLENLAITFLTIVIGNAIIRKYGKPYQPITKKQWLVCLVTNVINTIVTWVGFWLWTKGVIRINSEPSVHLLTDFFILFFAMDLLMFGFHYLIHHSFMYKSIHYFHHLSVNPTPVDLFILHPVETLAFGALWLSVLLCYSFNIYAIAIYLTVNVIFGMIGHLSLPSASNSLIKKYLGTSAFHHTHHQNIRLNYGFYTNIWDRLFGTYGNH